MAGVYTIDAMFVTDAAKLISGNLAALSAMVHLELPHVNVRPSPILPASSARILRVETNCRGASTGLLFALLLQILTKCDLVDEKVYEPLLSPSAEALARGLSDATGPRLKRLNGAIATLLDDYNMVSFVPLDPTSEDSIQYALAIVDGCIQYGEDMEPKEPRMDESDAAEAGPDAGASLASSLGAAAAASSAGSS